jgi:hypothetical protein
MKILALLVFLTGCASPFVLLVNPKTGTSVECSAVGIGLTRAIAVSNQVENCVKQYESVGYIRADALTAEQRAELNVSPPSSQHRTVMEAPPAPVTVTTPTAPRRPVSCQTVPIGGGMTRTDCN